MTKYPLREPFYNRDHSDRQDLYKKLLLSLYSQEDTLEETPILLRDIYTPLYVGINEDTEKSFSIEDTICKEQFIAISGVAGSGKSTITKFLSIVTAQNGTNSTVEKIGKRVVMPIILRELQFNKIHSLDDVFSQWIENINKNLKNPIFDRVFFDFYIQQGWAIIIFDGFDEIGVEQNRNLLKWINEYIQNSKLEDKEIKTNIIITGRPTGFLSGVEYEKHFKKLFLQLYTQEQINIYTDKYMNILYTPNQKMIEERKTKFLNRLESIKDLAQLKTRPIYLMMLAYISEHKGEMPRSRVLAYQLMTEAYIHILDKKRNLYDKENKEDIALPNWDYQDKYIMLEELAYLFHQQANLRGDREQLQIEVSRENLLKYLTIIVNDEDEKLKSVDKDECPRKILDYYLARSGLLVEPRDDFIQFSHLSFQEFLTASKIYRDKDDLDLIEYLNHEIFNKLEGIGFGEVAQLYFGIDSLRGGKNQDKITQNIFKDKFVYHKFVYDLIFLTENRLKENEEILWIKKLINLWVEKKEAYSFSTLITNLAKNLIEFKSENFKKEIERYIFTLAENILDEKKEDKALKLENILYIGYYFKEFKENFITKNKLKQFPKGSKNHKLAFVLDKYIP